MIRNTSSKQFNYLILIHHVVNGELEKGCLKGILKRHRMRILGHLAGDLVAHILDRGLGKQRWIGSEAHTCQSFFKEPDATLLHGRASHAEARKYVF